MSVYEYECESWHNFTKWKVGFISISLANRHPRGALIYEIDVGEGHRFRTKEKNVDL